MQQPVMQKFAIRDERTHPSHPPLTNLQLELLKLYAITISEQELVEIKALLARYFADRLTSAVDKIWEARGLTATDMEQWLNDERQ